MLTRVLCGLWSLFVVTGIALADAQKPAWGSVSAQATVSDKAETPLEEQSEGEKEVHAKEEALKSLFVRGDYTIIPLPAFTYSRNESYWIGGLVPILKANPAGELAGIFAPQYLHNRYVGETVTMNYYGYRSDTATYNAVASYSTKIQRDVDLSYKDLGAGGGRYILSGRVTWFKNAFRRFFGLSNKAPEQDETNYTSREALVQLTAGINLTPDFAIMVTERYHDVRIDHGAVASLPDTRSVFPEETGVEGAKIVGHRLTFFYDTRDKQLIPTRGTYANMSIEFNQNLEHDEPNRWVRTTFDARHLMPHASDHMVFVAHFLADTVNGRRTPFYERPTLGGETTLRAFGQSRFIDDTALLVNLEERIIVKEKKVFDYLVDLELAPFLDVGLVQSHFRPSNFAALQYNPGMGVRVLVRPHVVVRLDLAHGKDGINVFVGLDYPF